MTRWLRERCSVVVSGGLEVMDGAHSTVEAPFSLANDAVCNEGRSPVCTMEALLTDVFACTTR